MANTTHTSPAQTVFGSKYISIDRKQLLEQRKYLRKLGNAMQLSNEQKELVEGLINLIEYINKHANLIEAAPDLLEALEVVKSTFDWSEKNCDCEHNEEDYDPVANIVVCAIDNAQS